MPFLTLEGVSKHFGDVTAVDTVSFSIDRGEVVGFLGPNGAGKSTTMRMITQSLEPDQGTIRLDAIAVGDAPRESKRRIGYLPENNPLYGHMLVVDYLAFIADLRELPHDSRARDLDSAVGATGIESVYYRPISDLSKGYRQRVGLAQAILHRPDLLVLDEPTEGLDPNQRVEIRHLIQELGKDRTVLLSTHILPEVQRTCSRLLIISEGRIVADGPVDRLLQQSEGQTQVFVELEARGADAAELVGRVAGVLHVDALSEGAASRVKLRLTVGHDQDVRPAIFDLAKRSGWTLYELHQERASLEALFQQLTKSAEAES